MIAEQDTSWLWGAGLLGFAFGVAIGVGTAFWISRTSGRTGRMQREIERLQAELDSYRAQVTAHFRKTAALVGRMTESYRDVYEHLAQSSQQLCETPFQSPQLQVKPQDALQQPAAARPEPPAREAPKAVPRTPVDTLPGDEIFGDAPYVPGRPADETGARL